MSVNSYIDRMREEEGFDNERIIEEAYDDIFHAEKVMRSLDDQIAQLEERREEARQYKQAAVEVLHVLGEDY